MGFQPNQAAAGQRSRPRMGRRPGGLALWAATCSTRRAANGRCSSHSLTLWLLLTLTPSLSHSHSAVRASELCCSTPLSLGGPSSAGLHQSPGGESRSPRAPSAAPPCSPVKVARLGVPARAPAEFCDLGQRSFSRRQARLGLRGRGARQGSSRGRVAHGVCAVPRPPLPALFPFVTVP